MKKSILFLCMVLTAFSLMAFGYKNWINVETNPTKKLPSKTATLDYYQLMDKPDPGPMDLVYKVDSKFNRTITKETLKQAKSVLDIFPKEATQFVTSYQEVEVVLLHPDKDISKKGNGKELNNAQLELLQSADYSNDFYLSAFCFNRNPYTGELEKDRIIYYITIVPEKEAQFASGQDALIDYLKENSKEQTASIKRDQLKPGRVAFTITKKGTIANVKLTATSGYTSVDETLVELISEMPEQWIPASNSKGEKIDQEFIFFFGLEGC